MISVVLNDVGEFIQLSGLYAPPSEWIATQPSAFTMTSRSASGSRVSSRPAYSTVQRVTMSLTSPFLPMRLLHEVVAHAFLNEVSAFLQLTVRHGLCGSIDAEALFQAAHVDLDGAHINA